MGAFAVLSTGGIACDKLLGLDDLRPASNADGGLRAATGDAEGGSGASGGDVSDATLGDGNSGSTAGRAGASGTTTGAAGAGVSAGASAGAGAGAGASAGASADADAGTGADAGTTGVGTTGASGSTTGTTGASGSTTGTTGASGSTTGTTGASGSTSGASGAPSCATAATGTGACGPAAQSCCASIRVPGGTFDRSYDGVSSGYTNPAFPATVSPILVDQFEVTVGRFRPFVSAVVGGWRPAASAGKHAHLNGGNGLNAVGGGAEPGWDAADWNGQLAATLADWTTNLSCSAAQTWTPSPGSADNRPINCVDWYEAYAFCIWDGGFLPSEAEWNFTASGGNQQRVYPWSSPATSTAIDCSHANYFGGSNGTNYCVDPSIGSTNAVGSESPVGDGLWGQSDLGGNVWEWVLDTYVSPYNPSCTDCADLTAPASRVFRGGFYDSTSPALLASIRGSDGPLYRANGVGMRCARSP